MKNKIEWGLMGVGIGAGVLGVGVISIYWLLTESQNGNGVAIGALMVLSMFMGSVLTMGIVAAYNWMNTKENALVIQQMREQDLTTAGAAKANFSQMRADKAGYEAMMAQLKMMQQAKALATGQPQ